MDGRSALSRPLPPTSPREQITPLLGPVGVADTTPALGSRGVRELDRTVTEHGIRSNDVAGHFANDCGLLLDIAISDLKMDW